MSLLIQCVFIVFGGGREQLVRINGLFPAEEHMWNQYCVT